MRRKLHLVAVCFAVFLGACSRQDPIAVTDVRPGTVAERPSIASPTLPATTTASSTTTSVTPVPTTTSDGASSAELPQVETPLSRTPRLEPLPVGFSVGREAITDAQLLGPESSIYAIGRVSETDAVVVGSVRVGTDPAAATAWLVDMETGSTGEQWELPAISGRPSVATDVIAVDDGYVVIGVQFDITGAQGVSWRITTAGAESPVRLTCDCSAVEPEHVVVDNAGRLYVTGRVPGWQGYQAFWSSSDGGRSWSRPLVEPTGYNDTIHLAPLGEGAVSVYWSHVADDWGWRARVVGTEGDIVVSESDVPVPVSTRLTEVIATQWLDGSIWLVASDGSEIELMSSPDGRTWAGSVVPSNDFDRDPYATPIGLVDVDDQLTILMLHGDGVTDTITALTARTDGAYDSLSGTVPAPAYQTRYKASWPIVATASGVAVFDDGWTSGPRLQIVSASHPSIVELADIPPTRRVYRERVWSLSSAEESVAALVYRQSAAGPNDFVNLLPRVSLRVGGTWQDVELPVELDAVAGILPSGRNHVVAATTLLGTALVEMNGEDGTIDVDSLELAPFYADAVIGDAEGRMVASSGSGTSLWIRQAGEDWLPVPPLPGDAPTVASMCTDDTLTVALVDESSSNLSVMAFDGSSWSRLGSLPGGALRDPESPRCDISAMTVTVAYRDLVVAPVYYSAEMLSFVRADGGSGEVDYFQPQWPGDRITAVSRSASTASGAAVGLRDDAEFSYDAVAWTLAESGPASYVLLSGGPGIQEARSVAHSDQQVLVGGTDGGVAVVWSLP